MHDETRARGMVRDLDCVRCHLCIEACPQQALSFTASSRRSPTGTDDAASAEETVAPASARQFTLPVASEAAVLLVSVIAFLAWDLTLAAHFLAATLAVGEGFLALAAVETVRRRDFQVGKKLVLRRRGRWTFAGASVVGAFLLSLVPLAQGGAYRLLRHIGDSAFEQALPEFAPGGTENGLAATLGGSSSDLPTAGGAARGNALARAERAYRLAREIFDTDRNLRRRHVIVLAEQGDPRALAGAADIEREFPGARQRALRLWVEERLSRGDHSGGGAGPTSEPSSGSKLDFPPRVDGQ